MGKQGIWAFEISSADKIISAQNTQNSASAEYSDYDPFQEVTTDVSIAPLESVDTSQQELLYDVSSRGDQLHTSYNLPQPAAADGDDDDGGDLQPPPQASTEPPPVDPPFPTGKTPPIHFPTPPFPRRQHPQVIDVEEVDEAGIGKISWGFLTLWNQGQGNHKLTIANVLKDKLSWQERAKSICCSSMQIVLPLFPPVVPNLD